MVDDGGLSNLPLARRPVVGYLIRSMMASNRLYFTSIMLQFPIGLYAHYSNYIKKTPSNSDKHTRDAEKNRQTLMCQHNDG